MENAQAADAPQANLGTTSTAIPSIEEFLEPAVETPAAAAPVEAVAEAPKRPKAAEFAAIARKERELLDGRKELETSRAKYTKAETAVANKDAIAALEALGLNFDDALAAYIEKQSATPAAEPVDEEKAALIADVATLKAERAAAKASANKASDERNNQAVVSEISKLIEASADTLDRVSRFPDSATKIYDALSIHWTETGGKGDAKIFIEQNFAKAARMLEDHYASEYQRLAPSAQKTNSVEAEAVKDSRPRTLTNDAISGQSRVAAPSSSMTIEDALQDALASLKH